MKRMVMFLMCVCAVSMANALTITNGDFETGAGDNIADVTGWYDNNVGGFWEDVWQTNNGTITPNGTCVVVLSDFDATANPLVGSYLYQSMGVSTGESSVTIGFDWGCPDDVNAGRYDGLTISAYASDGTFAAADAVDVYVAAGVTLLDSASYDYVALGTDGEIFHVVVTLDLSAASAGDEIFLRFNNYRPGTTDSWPVLDNVKILAIDNNSPANGAVNIPVARTSPGNDLVFTVYNASINKVDVQLGLENDPNLTSKPAYKIVSNLAVMQGQYAVNLESLPADLTNDTTYYWKVIGYEPNAIPGGIDIKTDGPVSSFTTKPEDLTPIVDAGDSVITTLALNVLTLHGSVEDDGTTPLTVNWEAYDVAFGGGLTTKVTFTDPTDPGTTVTISESGTYILNLSATDATGTVSDTIEIAVYDDDCVAAKATGARVANYYDRDDNCVVNILDFSEFALEWLDSTGLTESYLHSATVTAGTDNALFAEYWTGISGSDPNSLLEDTRYPDNPNGSYLVVNQLSGSMTGDNYGQRIRGYIVPQTSGTYTFYIASDNGSRLFLSADTTPVDTDPALGNQIAEVPGWGWTDSNEWTKYPEQKSAPVTLFAGQYYYVEILQKEDNGGDNVSVGWSTDGGTTITVVPGAVLRYALP